MQSDGYLSLNVTICYRFVRREAFVNVCKRLYLSSGTASTRKLDISSMVETELAPFLTLLCTLFARNET